MPITRSGSAMARSRERCCFSSRRSPHSSCCCASRERRPWMCRINFMLMAMFALIVPCARADAESNDIKALLDDGKPDSIQRALTAIHGLNAREAIDGLRGGWMSRLLDLDRNQDV